MISEMTKQQIHAQRNEIERCPICNANIKDRKITLYRGIIRTLYSIYCWCKDRGKHEFTTKQIKQRMTHNDYARFGDLIRFGGIVYKPKDENGKTRKAQFGINMSRADAFFHGNYRIPVQITIDQIRNEVIDKTEVDIKDFPELHELLKKDGLYDDKKVISGQQKIL